MEGQHLAECPAAVGAAEAVLDSAARLDRVAEDECSRLGLLLQLPPQRCHLALEALRSVVRHGEVWRGVTGRGEAWRLPRAA